MVTNNMYQKLAKLAVRRGVNVQKDQPLIINANVRDIEFIKMVVKEAYEAGAKYVDVNWRDEELSKMKYDYQSIDTLSDIPQWLYDRIKTQHDQGACYLSIISDKPGALADVDGDKLHAYEQAYFTKTKDLMAYAMNNEGQWCVLGVPSVEWAKVVFPELSDEEAFEKLADALFKVSRVSEDNDPLEEWEQHDNELLNHCKILNEYNFKELHYTSELGTDFTIGLVKDHIWVGGGSVSAKGIYFDPNIPTEECFTMPDKFTARGIVYASKPLNYSGKLIEDFWLKFEDGKVVDFDAKKGKEDLQRLLEFDKGSSYLGEVALVPYESPISKMNMLFYETLYDENAACHLALGRPYPENIKNGEQMSEEELAKCGANDSMQHEDFMFGTEKMNIDGIQYDGTIVPVFRDGNFVF